MGLKIFNFFNICRKNETITVIAFSNAAGQVLVPFVKYVSTKQETADGFLPGSNWYTKWKWSFIIANVFLYVLHRALPQTKFSLQVILLLDGYRFHCSSPLIFRTAAENNTAIIRLPSQCIHTVLLLDKCFLGLEKLFQKRNHSLYIIRYHMVRLIVFAWSEAACVGVGVSAFESTGIYRLNGNRIPEYFSISDSGKTITFVATTRPNMAAVVVACAS